MSGSDQGVPSPLEYERLRQASVFASGVLAMRGNAKLQSIVERAAALLNTPIAAISVIDRDRQWFPVSIGLDIDATSREASFCAHAILSPGESFVVPDARTDERFAQNPLVTGRPSIRFYAGVPIVTAEGMPLGAICAIDQQSRPALTPEQDRALKQLAAEAVEEIERVEHARRFAADAIELIVNQIRDAAAREDEELLIALDRVLQSVERKLGSVPQRP